MRRSRSVIALVMALVLSASSAYAWKKDGSHERHRAKAEARQKLDLSWDQLLLEGIARATDAAKTEGTGDRGLIDLSAYEGLGSWIDIFNTNPWANPAAAVKTMAERGARSIFLQTSTYGQSGGIYDERAIDEFIEEAHARDMKVVAWYVPSFTQQKIDLQRSLRAINYRTPSGQRFDSFGLDIEATHVSDIGLRNERLLALSRRIRKAAGPDYPLSAITPDPVLALYWVDFPYEEVADIYDVIVPMGYFTFRASGYEEVRDYTDAGVRNIRKLSKDKDVPIHFIGGIAGAAGPIELRGFVDASRDQEILGASLYDYPITSRRSWYEMRALGPEVASKRRAEAAQRRERAAARAEAAAERREAREERRKRRADERRAAAKGRDEQAKSKKKERSGRHNRPANGGQAKGEKDRKPEKQVKERRKPSSSASRRDRDRSRTGGRERLRLREEGPSPLRS